MPSPEKVRIAAVADVHCTRGSHGLLQPLFAEASEIADVLLLGGDLTDYGLPQGGARPGVPVYNVSLPILKRAGQLFRILEVPAVPAERAA